MLYKTKKYIKKTDKNDFKNTLDLVLVVSYSRVCKK